MEEIEREKSSEEEGGGKGGDREMGMGMGMGGGGKWWKIGAGVAIIGILREVSKHFGWERAETINLLKEQLNGLGFWGIPVFVGVHALTISLCLPYAIFFEAAASILFGFFPAVLSVFSAKLLGASISFWLGRLVFRSSSSALEWVHRNKYFHLLSRGVEKDGWKFVLLARFSPMPSYVINYALSATNVGFIVDFLLPTVIGCLPMILQNTSIGSLAGAAVSSASGSQKSKVWSYVFPLLGILSSLLISLRIKKYATDITSDNASDNNIVSDGEKKSR